MILAPPASLTVISPHLDDAVFSCGTLIAACPGARVVTVFAGVPPTAMPAPPWDRDSGFAMAAQAVHTRRSEDSRALIALGATPVWLDFLDAQYGRRYTPAEIAAGLAPVLAAQPGMIAAPMGLFHADHALVHAASMRLLDAAAAAAQASPRRWLFYEDAIYRRMSGPLHERLAQWHREGRVATAVELPPMPACEARKREAVQAYASQLPMFDAPAQADLGMPERYWACSVPQP